MRNGVARDAVTGTADVVVSLTSYGDRIHSVAVAIESIGRGTVKPRRLILWLDSRELFEARPESLARLERRGLEVKLTSNYGPHTKYFPFVQSVEGHTARLVTADDDIIYPRNWLALLLDASRRHPDAISGHWVSVMGISDGAVAEYGTWPRAKDTAVRPTNFAPGVSGVIYPPAMLDELRRRGDGFLSACPGADDIWLHWVALRAGIPVRQVRSAPRHFPIIPGSQGQALMKTNVGENRNDHWIRGLYTAQDVAALSATTAGLQLNQRGR
ncbi:hypothetical protein [Arthrobacter sp. PAMC25284]|uniref:hypothetical protein n=1 Tax=Arthrobacter sp. PAMC25284 TaxID=2861279 RepID=UPI001C62986F|nr:hypothetical protein [Arthrobacter sp. PAMC25284]QYF90898.1 hypothetical protein KY499_06615 [Arthrobacter sp. PAMC25284]